MRAIVLAGGKGERLRPYTTDRPKPMVEIHGRPILAYQLSWLQRHGVGEIVISCGYRCEVIREYFGDGSAYGLRIRYAVEETPLGRGGGIKAAFALLDPSAGDEPIVGTNGDILTDLDLSAMVAEHRRRGVVATLYLAQLRSPYGIVELDDGRLVRAFREKPELPYWVNGGLYVFSPAIRPALPDLGDIEELTFPQLAAAGQLAGHPARAYWRPVDTVKDLTEVQHELEAQPLPSLPPWREA